MKIKHCNSIQQNSLSFSGGLNKKILKEISDTNVGLVSHNLLKDSIITDFQGNKTVAWCCQKVVTLIKEINKKYGLSLTLPKGIFVRDFDGLNLAQTNMYGFCNMQPVKLLKNKDVYIPSRTLFFNSFEGERFFKDKNFFNWENIDEISDFRFANKFAPTDYFLDIFFHEFAHVLHENHLIKTLGADITSKKLEQIEKLQKMGMYDQKYGIELSKICKSAASNPFESIACDISKIMSENINKDKMFFNSNPLKHSPYDDNYIHQFNTKLNNILRNFWEGIFE